MATPHPQWGRASGMQQWAGMPSQGSIPQWHSLETRVPACRCRALGDILELYEEASRGEKSASTQLRATGQGEEKGHHLLEAGCALY